MKTEKEQIEEMVKVIKGFENCGFFCSCFSIGADGENKRDITCPECFAEALIKAGYGDVSEYKEEISNLKHECKYRKKQYDNQLVENTRLNIDYDRAFQRLKSQQREIDKLKAELEKRLTCDFVKTAQKQAKIDVLKELKTRHDYAIKNMGYPWNISQQIDELIAEVDGK